MEVARTFRHEIYDKLNLNQEQRIMLRKAFDFHDNIKLETVQKLWKESIPKIEKATQTVNKIKQYIYKAKSMPQSPKLIGQKEALELCLQWLTEE